MWHHWKSIKIRLTERQSLQNRICACLQNVSDFYTSDKLSELSVKNLSDNAHKNIKISKNVKFLFGFPNLYLHKFKAKTSVQLVEKSGVLLTWAVFVSDIMLLKGTSDRPLAWRCTKEIPKFVGNMAEEYILFMEADTHKEQKQVISATPFSADCSRLE